MIEKVTILHSNDIHGDFYPKEENGRKTGGISLLAGYVNKVRSREKQVLYAVAGDMFRGSIVDSEHKGLSTIHLMNLLRPDVVGIGNHEVDYGIAHALFTEKCASFPIINANLYIKTNLGKVFEPYYIARVGGLNIMFISLVTQDLLKEIKNDIMADFYIGVADYAYTVGLICDLYKTEDINCVVLLTHIGIEEDKKLAAQLRSEWGVNLIIGGHSHTRIEESVYVNGIPIVQAGLGSAQLGQAEMEVDTESGKTVSFRWKLVSIDSEKCEEDATVNNLLAYLDSDISEKYDSVLTVMERKLTNHSRAAETEIGNLFTDLLASNYKIDIACLGANSLRKPEMGPVVTRRDFEEMFPFTGEYYSVRVTGAQLRRMFAHVLREDAINLVVKAEYYHISKGCRFVWSRGQQKFLEFSFNGAEITDDQLFVFGLQAYHLANFAHIFGVPLEEISQNGKPRLVFCGLNTVLEELVSTSSHLNAEIEGRIQF